MICQRISNTVLLSHPVTDIFCLVSAFVKKFAEPRSIPRICNPVAECAEFAKYRLFIIRCTFFVENVHPLRYSVPYRSSCPCIKQRIGFFISRSLHTVGKIRIVDPLFDFFPVNRNHLAVYCLHRYIILLIVITNHS